MLQQSKQEKTKTGTETRRNTGCYMQLLSIGNVDDGTVPSVLLFFDNQRYIFNVGEGFQRFSLEYKIMSKIGSKMEAIMMTQLGPQTLGGLPGLILSMDSHKIITIKPKESAVPLFGPQNVDEFLQSIAAFSQEGADQFRAMPIDFMDQECATIIDDGYITIKGTALHVNGTEDDDIISNGSKQSDTNSRDSDGQPLQKKPRVVYRVRDGQMVRRVNKKQTVLCYICELKDLRGKFLPQQAAKLGVPKGPLFGKLQRGESVKSMSGKMITPDQVMEPSVPGPVALVIDCPTMEHLEPLLASQPLKQLQELSRRVKEETKSELKFVHIIFHLGPSSVINSSDYQKWIHEFGSVTQHIIACQAHDTTGHLRGSATVQMKLNALDSSLFPLKKQTTNAINNGSSEHGNIQNGASVENKELNLLRFTMIPFRKAGIDKSEVQEELNCEQIQEEVMSNQEFVKLLDQFQIEKQQALQNTDEIPDCLKNVSDKELEIVFLGTGAALPSKYRNTTGTLFDFFEKGTMLIDCGEYSYKQLLRKYGQEGCKDIIRRLKAVWISHIHADHHAGLYAIIEQYAKLVGNDGHPLIVFGPRSLGRIMYSYTKVCYHVNFRYVMNSNLLGAGDYLSTYDWASKPDTIHQRVTRAISIVKNQFGLESLETFPTLHCKYSYGLVMIGKSGWKVVVSGDSYPCESLKNAAKGATLLIQECTFENSLQEEAEEKRHCTNEQAIDISKQAEAYRTILSHFSQRYPKIPRIDEIMESDQKNLGIAFDLMTVNLKDLPWLPKTLPLFKELFKQELIELQDAVNDDLE